MKPSHQKLEMDIEVVGKRIDMLTMQIGALRDLLEHLEIACPACGGVGYHQDRYLQSTCGLCNGRAYFPAMRRK